MRSQYNAQPHVTEQALWGNVLEDVIAAALKELALGNFGQIAQLCGHLACKGLHLTSGISREYRV
jgi:hypothetical protein